MLGDASSRATLCAGSQCPGADSGACPGSEPQERAKRTGLWSYRAIQGLLYVALRFQVVCRACRMYLCVATIFEFSVKSFQTGMMYGVLVETCLMGRSYQ